MIIPIILTITVISLEHSTIFADEVIKTIPVGERPNTVEYNPINNSIYVPITSQDKITSIDSSNNKKYETQL